MIERVTNSNLDEVLPLVRAYQEFYEVPDINEAKNRAHFSRFTDDNTRGVLFLLRHDGQAVGFATIYFSYSSGSAEEIGILNDLYVSEEFRNQGYGKQLILHAISEIKKRGLKKLQWLTAKQNTTAQKLYDSLNANKSEWYLYTTHA